VGLASKVLERLRHKFRTYTHEGNYGNEQRNLANAHFYVAHSLDNSELQSSRVSLTISLKWLAYLRQTCEASMQNSRSRRLLGTP
jgi:hypothetical protein